MSWLFGKKKTPKELLRENKRQLDRAIRDIDRERMSLQSQEKKLIVEMKKMAKGNQNDAVKVMAKSLIRMRHNITKYYTVKSQLQAVSMRMQVCPRTHAQPSKPILAASSLFSSSYLTEQHQN
jgi:charged multivesicular body protein 2A